MAWIGRDLAVSYREAQIVQKVGGSAQYDYEYDGNVYQKDASPPGPAYLRFCFGDHLYARVVSLNVQKQIFNREMANEVAELDRLKSLLFMASSIEEDSMEPLRELKNLRSLGFAETSISGKQLRQFRECEQITAVSLFGSSASDENLVEISHFPNLEMLGILGGPATDIGLSSLGSLSTVERLYIHNVPALTAKGFPPLTNLQELSVQCDLVSNDSLTALQQSTSLHKLTLLTTKKNSKKKALQYAANLAWMGKFQTYEERIPNDIESAAMLATGQLTSLRELKFETHNIFNQDLQHLSKMPNLEVLRIQPAIVSREGMVHLKELPKLKEIHVRWSQGIKPGQVGAANVIVDN